MRIVVVDGQGGGIGRALVEQLRQEERLAGAEIICAGTNGIATSAMLRAGATQGATGENAIIVCSRSADIITGPIGIMMKDAMLGEITGAMAEAITDSRAERVLIPVSRSHTHIAGFSEMPMKLLVEAAVKQIAALAEQMK